MLSANSLHAKGNVSSLHWQTYSTFTTSWPTGIRQNMKKGRFAQGPAFIYGTNNRSINLSAREQHFINCYCLCHLKSFLLNTFFKCICLLFLLSSSSSRTRLNSLPALRPFSMTAPSVSNFKNCLDAHNCSFSRSVFLICKPQEARGTCHQQHILSLSLSLKQEQ